MTSRLTSPSSFQFTLPCRERHTTIDQLLDEYGFNSRSRVGSDSPYTSASSSTRRFNSRSRVGSDSTTRCPAGVGLRFQFTLPCRERQERRLRIRDLIEVSIHAPV